MKKIKILMHTQPKKDSFNAQDLNGREIASRFNSEKFDIYFINLDEDEIDEKLKKNNIHIINIKTRNKILREILILKVKLFSNFNISFYIRVFKSDNYFLKLLKLFKIKRICIHMVENMLPYPNVNKEYQNTAKYNALGSDYVFPISKKVSETVEKEYSIIPNEIVHIGVDTSLFLPNYNKNNKRLKIVSCGTFQKRKQPDLFVEISKEFKDMDFYWIGEGVLKNDLIQLIEKENLKNIFLLDNKPHKELSNFLSNSDIFLFPSIHEGFPKVIIEAMASGLPVIAFDTYGPESIINSETGYIVRDYDEMKSKLKYLCDNNDIRKEISVNAVKRAHEFDWNIIVNKWENIIINAIKNAN
jgi:glycosyltransferase involved in cell wall biosynthesis